MATPMNVDTTSNTSNGNKLQRQQTALKKKSSPNEKKLQLMRGALLTCDPPLKQFLVKLNNDSAYKFIMRELDEDNLFISVTKYPPQYNNVMEWLQKEVEDWNKKWTYIDEGAKYDENY